MRRTRIAAATVMVAAGLIGAVAAPASAGPKTAKPAEALCTSQGGTFGEGDHNVLYGCVPPTGELFSEAQLRAARTMCEKTYKAFGTEFITDLPPEVAPPGSYACLANLLP